MSIFHIINFKKKKFMDTGVLDFFNKKLILDYYFCLKSSPVYLFQIFIKTSHMVLSIIFLEDKHKILLHLSISYEYQQFFQHRICFSIQPQLQLVNLHRNRRYFVIKLHTWFCLSYFLKTNIKLYCIYQYFMSINSFFNTVSVSRYSRPITVTRDPD